ncbi:MAG: repair protein RecN [Betaproteobacteria bacterium]|jgi:DNA repair protein RecN (Recombination protein N)|nr:repair protein RecN [Betaproteobacteria bacterium]
MLRALDVKDFVLVERSSLELGAGFGVLTGETGAGKSMLVDAIELLVGGRAEGDLVRAGAERAELSAEFDSTDAALAAWLGEADLQGDPGTIILRRTIDRTGRSRSFINGHPATLAQLREVGERLVDLHGQHEHQSLLRAAAQRDLLDAHAGSEALVRETGEAFRTWKRLETLIAEAEKNYSAREAERAEVDEKVRDLKALKLEEGEWERVSAEHTRLQHGSSLLAGAQSTLEALAEADGATLTQLEAVASRLRALSEHDSRLKAVTDMLESASAQAGEAVRELRHYAERVDLDPAALREAEARIEALHAAGRRHRVRPEALVARLAELEARLSELALSGDPEALRKEVAAARGRFDAAAKKLSAKRCDAAQKLSKAVSAAMQQLAMAGGRFSVALNETEPSAHGREYIDFEVASHPSLPLRPLAKVASGGELSRISLAIQLVAAGSSPVGTLVFDEIDSGIGGAVAETIGRSLRKLGKERQVLCVTHLPQVAASGTEQWTVTRSGVKVKVAKLDRAARVAELARMLGGAESTARKHASELLDAG